MDVYVSKFSEWLNFDGVFQNQSFNKYWSWWSLDGTTQDPLKNQDKLVGRVITVVPEGGVLALGGPMIGCENPLSLVIESIGDF